MSNIIILGAQWGDEGKGKLVDLLADRFEYIVRYQGGNNVYHGMILIGRSKFVLRLVPSGILHPGKVAVIGKGLNRDSTGAARGDRATGRRRSGCRQSIAHQQPRAGPAAFASAGGENFRSRNKPCQTGDCTTLKGI